MKTNIVMFASLSLLVSSLIIIGTFKTGIVSALTATTTDATSTASDTTTASTSSTSANSMPSVTDASSTSPTATAQTQAPTQSQGQSLPSSGKPALKLVHVAGTKYIDYFTDGSKTYSFPGDPKVDANLNKPNAPIPSHAGLTWVSTSGMEAYDTASGDLEVGDYAQEADGSYLQQYPRLHLHRRDLERSCRRAHCDLENRSDCGELPITSAAAPLTRPQAMTP